LKERPEKEKSAVDESVYDDDYFTRACGGADWLTRFMNSGGDESYPHYRQLVERLQVSSGQLVLDVGCGRGEVSAMLARSGVHAIGLDYSRAALDIARQVQQACQDRLEGNMAFVRSDATLLPFADGVFDRVVMADIVEHLYDWQLDCLYDECRRVLKPGGMMLIHTWPNCWHTEYTYPVIARVSRLFGSERSLSPRKPHDEIVHVNEQSLSGLRNHVKKCGFGVLQQWCEHDAPFSLRPDRFIYWLLHRAPGLRLWFADHLWLLAKKD